jgi:hypothetical protein
MRWARLALVLLMATSLVAQPTTAQATHRRHRLITSINDARQPDVHHRIHLDRLAKRNSRAMAREGRIFHSGVCCAEVIGVVVRGRLRALFRAWMDSPEHRAIIVDPAYRRVGIGIAVRPDFLWVTVIFEA